MNAKKCKLVRKLCREAGLDHAATKGVKKLVATLPTLTSREIIKYYLMASLFGSHRGDSQ